MGVDSMVDIFKIFEDLENEALESKIKLSQTTEDNKSAEYSEEPETISQVSSEDSLIKDSQGSSQSSQTNTTSKEVITNELQQESVSTD